jgi:hydrogenase maturation protease
VSVPAHSGSLAGRGALVVGYGNPLRSDDGIGWQVAGRLASDPRLAGVEVLQVQQLTPELALDFSRADLVVLVDARSGPAAGTIATERLEAATGTEAGPGSTAWSHHLGPASLVGLANELYGRSGELVVVSVGVASLEVGERLSPLVAAAVERVVDEVVRLVAGAAVPDAQPAAGTGDA